MEALDGAKVEVKDDYPPMPFFSIERLSDQQVADILAHWDYVKFTLNQATSEETEPDEDAIEMLSEPTPEDVEDSKDEPAEPGPLAEDD